MLTRWLLQVSSNPRIPNDWLESDERPATSGLRYVNAKEQKWGLVLTVPTLGSIHIRVVEDVENPKSLLDVVTLSLSS